MASPVQSMETMTLEGFGKLIGMVLASIAPHANPQQPYEIGKNYIIRSVTMTNTGRVVAVTDNEVVLEDAAWIADTARFADSVAGRIEFNEIEPFPDGKQVIMGRGAIVDACQIDFPLPRKQK